jgi:hypothetical protein
VAEEGCLHAGVYSGRNATVPFCNRTVVKAEYSLNQAIMAQPKRARFAGEIMQMSADEKETFAQPGVEGRQ